MDNENEYIPEQLDDEEFEKEKEEKKRLKEQKKLEKKAKKQKENTDSEENNEDISEENNEEQVHKRKRNKIIIVVPIIVVLLVIIGGITAYFIINKNKPENVLIDCVSYFNDENWDEFINCIDFKGAYALGYLDKAEYTKFDEEYDKVEEEADYDSYIETINSFSSYNNEIFDREFKGITLKVGKVISVDKIENTKSLHKVRVEFTMSDSEQSQTTVMDFYVSKVDKEYKLVDQFFPTIVMANYINYYLQSTQIPNEESQE